MTETRKRKKRLFHRQFARSISRYPACEHLNMALWYLLKYIESRRLGGCGWYQPCAIIFDSSAEGQKNEIHFYEPGNDLPEFWPEAEYGKSWRCWPRKPTPEQMAAEKWEE